MADTSRKSRSRRSEDDTSGRSSSQRRNSSSSLSAHFNLGDVEHGLQYPEFDPNAHFATDLFSDSSPLPRTSKVDADAACASIEEKRQTLRLAQSNIALNQDAVSTGVAFQKLVGTVIDHGTAQVNNHTKFTGYQTARTNLETAHVKWGQAQERLYQEQAILDGMVELTPLIREEWEQKRGLKQSRIADLKQSVFEANAKLDADVRQLASAV
ncbi:hypothetical protein IQ268_28655 [Oculatella sp. LEGE 06141]|uniref:hypothetical protein n=1 Tax=Oculatella sp. LEGE 06141 TaxID=1828648 RepID=UPI001883077A|nr:hypothetical protein [Oculatella sp. LEGE 06141]MBE9182525.1 hypothetical protein [Oculatella sp. LEGE 06141]